MVSLTVFVVFANAPPMGLDAFEGDEEEVEPPLPPAEPLDALPDVDAFEGDEAEDEEDEVEPPLPPAAPLDGCAGPTKALSEEGPVLGIYLL
jgi:hypothetical protein